MPYVKELKDKAEDFSNNSLSSHTPENLYGSHIELDLAGPKTNVVHGKLEPKKYFQLENNKNEILYLVNLSLVFWYII